MASSSIRFPCPRCGGTMKSPAGQAGQTCHCPKCQALVVVPGAEGTGTGPAVTGDVPAAAVPPPISPVLVPNSSVGVTGTPVRPDAGVPVAESPPATPVQPAEETWYLRCPLCRSTVEVPASQQGTTVRCGDCHGPVLVKAPGGELRSSRKALGAIRPADSGQPATDDVVTDFRLGEAVAPPSYIPSPAEGIDAVELYGRVPVSRVLPARKEEEPTGGHVPQPAVVAVHCPLCHTRLHVAERKIGHQVRCPDCHSEFTARARQTRVTSQGLSAPPAGDDVEFRLSEAVVPPKFQPLARGTVTRADLDAVARLRRETAGGAPPGSEAQSSANAAALPKLTVVCPHCRSRLEAESSRVGETMVCPDCHNPIEVVAARPRPRPVTSTPVPDSEDLPAELIVARAAGDVDPERADREVARRLFAAAEEEEAEREREQERLAVRAGSRRRYLGRLIGFLGEPEVLLRSVLVAFCVTIVLGILGWMFAAVTSDSELLWVFTVVMSVFAAVLVVMTGLYTSSVALTILLDTAEDYPVIENWSDGAADWVAQAAQIGFAVVAASGAGAVVSLALSALAVPSVVNALVLVVASFLLFPIVLLSILEGESLLSFVSPDVVRSLVVARRAWWRFYATAIVLAGLMGLGLAGVFSGNWLLLVGSGPVVAVVGLVYFRALGLLAERCTAIMGGVEDREASDLGRERPEEEGSPPASRTR